MPYTQQVVNNFSGGLNLRDKADTVQPGQAIDALNVYFTDRGAIVQRPGTAKFTTSALTTAPKGLMSFIRSNTADRQLVVGGQNEVNVLNTSGAVVSNGTINSATTPSVTATGSDKPWTFARFGAPASSVVSESAYAGNGYDKIYKWSGSAWTQPSTMPKARCLAVVNTPSIAAGGDLAPRMAVAGFETTTGGPGSAASSPSHVYFSNAGTAETWTSSNYVQLSPGDGEEIVALIPWRGFIFAFKQSKFFVFYGESLDSTGNPVFNYRAVESGEGAPGPYAVVAARDGVYFANENGVFRTTGSDPEKVSDLINPLFLGNPSGYFKGGAVAKNKIADIALGVNGDQVYVSYSQGGSYNDRTLVYDIQHKWWSLYDFEASSFGLFKIGNDTELVFTRSNTSNDVVRFSRNYTADFGTTAITARWRSGWVDFGVASMKTMRESKIWGAGQCFIGQTSDYAQGVGVSELLNFAQAAITQWNTSNWYQGKWENPVELIPRVVRLATRGSVFSTVLSNSELDKTFQISRMVHHLRATRIPTIRDTEDLT